MVIKLIIGISTKNSSIKGRRHWILRTEKPLGGDVLVCCMLLTRCCRFDKLIFCSNVRSLTIIFGWCWCKSYLTEGIIIVKGMHFVYSSMGWILAFSLGFGITKSNLIMGCLWPLSCG
ncbi:hypothetical protein QVD17_38068 [Tagetes erecta]|uniref:Uncharacterized protein n=1 Tax=Tagetes erecta TaxID=13708 RepID=A0AAD8JX89_TARER|nr:hypothetical protein QVD17_38068 [Tagetes erecta]